MKKLSVCCIFFFFLPNLNYPTLVFIYITRIFFNLCINTTIRSHVATEENVQEAIRLFTVSTMDAARSGIHQQVNLTPEMANEIKVGLILQPGILPLTFS